MLRNDASEKLFMDQVIKIARMNGWHVFHPASMKGHDGAWRTPLTGDKGFPDLVLVHERRGLIFAELKTERGRLSEEQKRWGMALCQHAEYYVWRPNQLQIIADRLGAR